MQQEISLPRHTRIHSRHAAESALATFLTCHFKNQRGPIIIAIGGPGGSGKTVFAQKLQRRLGNCGIIHLDGYKTSRQERQNRQIAGPNPEANQMSLVHEHLVAIKNGASIRIPIYDTETGDTGTHEAYSPRQFTLIEGEIATYDAFRTLIDLSLFIDSDFKTQLAARTGRDVEQFGHSLKKALTTFLTSNLTDYALYGASSKEWSDVHLFCHSDYHMTIEAVTTSLYAEFIAAVGDVTTIVPQGLIVPVATPFETDLAIAEQAYVTHLSWLSGKGVSRILAGGTTAEFFSLTLPERVSLLRLGREFFPGSIIFNISSDSVATTIDLARQAKRFGADSLICLPPYYYANAPEQGLINYFTEVGKACDLPLYLYNFPKHTGNPLTPGILRAVPHAGIKDSAANLPLAAETPVYLLGGDSQIIEAYSKGATGFVPGLPNAFPEIYCALEEALRQNDLITAENLQTTISQFKKSLPKVSGIVVVKQYLSRLLPGYPATVRPPLYAAPDLQIDVRQQLIR